MENEFWRQSVYRQVMPSVKSYENAGNDESFGLKKWPLE